MTQYLFVYGTLKRRGGSRHRALLGQAEYMGEATYQGRLYRVSWYPAAVASSAADAHVCGELYRLEADADRLLRAIDQYEGCDAVDPEYERWRRRLDVPTELEFGPGSICIDTVPTIWSQSNRVSFLESQVVSDDNRGRSRAESGDGWRPLCDSSTPQASVSTVWKGLKCRYNIEVRPIWPTEFFF